MTNAGAHRTPFRQRSTTRNIQLSSTVYFPTVRAYRDAIKGLPVGTGQSVPGSENNYGIEGNPSLHELQLAISQREMATNCYLYPTGLAAITAVLDACVDPGQHLLLPDAVYGPTRSYCSFLQEHKGIQIDFYESENVDDLRSLIKAKTRVIYIESPASITFDITDYEAVVQVAQEHDIITIADNTWASLCLSQPLSFGIDISITSLTKYAAGYSDVFMGAVALRNEELNSLLNRHHNMTGAYGSPFDATLVTRGLESLDVRIRQHGVNALQIVELLQNFPHKKIYFNQPDSPAFAKYFSGINGLLSVELSRTYSDDELEAFFSALEVFRLGESWGGTHSLILPIQPEYFSTLRNAPSNTILRVHSGLEPIDDQLDDLQRALSQLEVKTI